jgi:hypothetical protein
MDKEEYLRKAKEDIWNMDIEQLREYCWKIDQNSQIWFHNWMETLERVHELEAQLYLKK